jgi:hypothetical protein
MDSKDKRLNLPIGNKKIYSYNKLVKVSIFRMDVII